MILGFMLNYLHIDTGNTVLGQNKHYQIFLFFVLINTSSCYPVRVCHCPLWTVFLLLCLACALAKDTDLAARCHVRAGWTLGIQRPHLIRNAEVASVDFLQRRLISLEVRITVLLTYRVQVSFSLRHATCIFFSFLLFQCRLIGKVSSILSHLF